jgi:hypothetical protein
MAQETALQPITIGPLPEAVKLDENALPELPVHTPPPDLRH